MDFNCCENLNIVSVSVSGSRRSMVLSCSSMSSMYLKSAGVAWANMDSFMVDAEDEKGGYRLTPQT